MTVGLLNHEHALPDSFDHRNTRYNKEALIHGNHLEGND